VLTIQEAATRMGTTTSTIRYYDKVHLLPHVQRDQNNHRLFQEEDLIWIKLVTTLREINMPIATIQQYVTLAGTGRSTLNQRLNLMSQQQEVLLKELQLAELRYAMANRWVNHYVQLSMDPTKINFPQDSDPAFPEELQTGFHLSPEPSSNLDSGTTCQNKD